MILLSPPPRVAGVCASTPSLQGAEDQIQSSHQHSDNQRHKKKKKKRKILLPIVPQTSSQLPLRLFRVVQLHSRFTLQGSGPG